MITLSCGFNPARSTNPLAIALTRSLASRNVIHLYPPNRNFSTSRPSLVVSFVVSSTSRSPSAGLLACRFTAYSNTSCTVPHPSNGSTRNAFARGKSALCHSAVAPSARARVRVEYAPRRFLYLGRRASTHVRSTAPTARHPRTRLERISGIARARALFSPRRASRSRRARVPIESVRRMHRDGAIATTRRARRDDAIRALIGASRRESDSARDGGDDDARRLAARVRPEVRATTRRRDDATTRRDEASF